jgi:hypothetical protein
VGCVQANYIKAVGVGVLKVMAKMGISTLQSYKGAQIFEALGLGEDIMAMCFPETSSRIGGLSLEGLGRSMMEAHLQAFDESLTNREDVNAKAVPDPGEYRHRVNQDGSAEVWPLYHTLCIVYGVFSDLSGSLCMVFVQHLSQTARCQVNVSGPQMGAVVVIALACAYAVNCLAWTSGMHV